MKLLSKCKNIIEHHKVGELLLNVVFAIAVINLIRIFIIQFSYPYEYESWQVSEWLINFQGGYVRRGLIGEMLYLIQSHYQVNVVLWIKIFSLLSLLLLLGFFLFQMIRKGIALYILSTCLFFACHIGNGMYWTKRDYFILILFIACLYTLKCFKNIFFNFIIINLLLILAIHIHEAIALFALPIIFLFVREKFSSYHFFLSVVISFLYLIPSLIGFLLVVNHHGNLITAQKIWDSWVEVLGASPAVVDLWSHGVISSIAWTSDMAIAFHRSKNFYSESGGILSIYYWISIAPVIYYIASNYMFVFSKNKALLLPHSRTIFSSILIFQFCCLLPFFLFLSCDIGRIVFYWMTSSFVVYFIIPEQKLQNIFPSFYVYFIQYLNQKLDLILKPNKTIIAILLLVIGIPTAGFSIEFIFQNSVIGNVLMLFSNL